ncbi:hypothetical protein SAPIO_CDS0559 [Scedosporium apiospermum]|uniref:Uncharacterized protein n=1 Tax=Pseudallescheria apiosperma TaxID=563466 RepID=A0A084GHA0_PSEDA|nr:uncharacterized protein SAPIO_CDS0559 [Scedosporium apiospermum]KEZ46712.1 hypothetical protein SAPIO_CDS0559 [Scedosporium apiospermum]
MSFVNRKNNVTELQRVYQTAYAQHNRIWKINPRSRWYMTPYLVLLWGTVGATMYAMGRKVAGYNTWFSNK